MQPKVNKWLDLLDRAGWTGLQAAGSAIITYFATGQELDWNEALSFVAVAVVLAICKVVVGQNTGTDSTGSLIGQSVIEPPPTD